MRRISSKALSHLASCTNFPFSLLSRDFIAHLSPPPAAIEPNLNQSFQTCFKICKKTKASCLTKFNTPRFRAQPPRSFGTVAEPELAAHMSSRQVKIEEKSELEQGFESTETTEDMHGVFKDKEASFDERELGLACLKLGIKLDQEGEDPEKILAFASRALKVFDKDDSEPSLPLAMTLQLLGSTCYSLKRINDSLGYLFRANRILVKLQEQNSSSLDDIRPIICAVQLDLANTKTAMGRRQEAIGNLRMYLEIREMTPGKGSSELGNANRDLAAAYNTVLNFKEALPFCLKALDIHTAQLGHNSLEVAHDRQVLGEIYTGLEQHGKALEQIRLAQKVLKNWGLTSDLVRAEIHAANIQIALGRYEEAINTLKGVVQETDKESEDRVLVYVSMAKALCNQEKFPDSKRCLEIACGILDKKQTISSEEAVEAYLEMSMQYESMAEFENAITLLKRTLALIENLPQEKHLEGSVSARIGWLLKLTGKVQEAIPYLESASERLKDNFGSKHFGVGYVYNNLGTAYLELDRPQSAAQVFTVAKEIMEVSLGPAHVDTIEACQNLAKAYDAMKSYPLAIKFQQQVVEAWEGRGMSAQDELKEASSFLEHLKNNARGVSSDEPTMKAFPLPHVSETISSGSSQLGVSLNQKRSSAL